MFIENRKQPGKNGIEGITLWGVRDEWTWLNWIVILVIVLPTKTSAPLSGFGDAASVSDYAVAPLQWAVGVGVINGMDGMLNPQGLTTRAQIARVLQQFCEIKPDMV